MKKKSAPSRLIVCLFVVILLLSSCGQELPTAVATLVPAPTSIPTRTPSPTETSAPTATPEPTATPAPTGIPATPTQGPTARPEEYQGVVEPAGPDANAAQGVNGSGEILGVANIARAERLYAIGGGEKRMDWEASRDGAWLANIDETHSPYSSDALLYNPQTGALQVEVKGYGDLDFSSDGETVAIGTEEGALLANLRTGTILYVLNQEYISSVRFSPDGTRVAAVAGGLDTPHTTVWDVASGARLAYLEGRALYFFSSDNKLFTHRADRLAIELWDISSGAPQMVLSQELPDDNWPQIFLSQDNTLMALWSGNEIVIWNMAGGTVQSVLQNAGELESNYGLIGSAAAAAFSPDGALLAGVGESTVQLWDVRTGAAVATLTGNESAEGVVGFSPDGRLLVFSGGGNNHAVHVWDVQAGALLLTAAYPNEGFLSRPHAFALSPDNALLAVASPFIPISADGMANKSGVQFWDVQTGQALNYIELTFPAFETLTLLAFSRDGSTLIASRDADGKLYSFGLIGAAVYRAGIRTAGQVAWKFDEAIPQDWRAVDPVPARYELLFQDQSIEAFTCPYEGNNKIVYYQQVIAVTITDLQTNEPIATRSFSGSATGACSPTHEFVVGGGVTLVEINEADVGEFQAWLQEVIPGGGQR